jgi:hypothetical protein
MLLRVARSWNARLRSSAALVPACAVRRTSGRNRIERSLRPRDRGIGIAANLLKQATLSLIDPVRVPFLDGGKPRPLRLELGVAIEGPIRLDCLQLELLDTPESQVRWSDREQIRR